MCQCPLFKQFTTLGVGKNACSLVFILCVNVLFLSNSQLDWHASVVKKQCLSYVSMSSF